MCMWTKQLLLKNLSNINVRFHSSKPSVLHKRKRTFLRIKNRSAHFLNALQVYPIIKKPERGTAFPAEEKTEQFLDNFLECPTFYPCSLT